MRWTRQRRRANGVAGRVLIGLVSVVRHADERRMLRTEKSCGPDAPTLASSLRRRAPAQPGQTRRQSASDGGKQARSPGRARRKPLKPLRREGRVSRRTLGDYARVLHLNFAREAAGASGTRLSLRPLLSEGQKFSQTSDAWRRENAEACLISTNAPYPHRSSPGLTRRPSIPETLMIEPKSCGVLDTSACAGYDGRVWGALQKLNHGN
jgi:hypothetical protein